MGNPGRGLLSFAEDIALVVALSNLRGLGVKLCHMDFLRDMWDELASLDQEASFFASTLKAAILGLNDFWREILGLSAAIWIPRIAVEAIFEEKYCQELGSNPKKNGNLL